MYPRPFFWYRRTPECTLVPFWYRGTSAKTTLLKAPVCEEKPFDFVYKDAGLQCFSLPIRRAFPRECDLFTNSAGGPKRGSLKSAGKRQESTTFLQRSFFNAAVQFFARCSAAFGKNDFRPWRKANVAVQFMQCNFPKIAAQLPVFACGMLQGWGLEGRGLGLAEIQGHYSAPGKWGRPRRGFKRPLTRF